MKRSVDADRECFGKINPAFFSDLSVAGHIQAGQARAHLQEVDRKSMVSGGVTRVKMHRKGVSIVGAHFRSHWVENSADTDRESLGKFGPAFVCDLWVVAHIQAGQVLVHLQGID